MHVLIPSTRRPAWSGGRIVRLGRGDDAYWRFWRRVWAAGRTVIVVEHDITPTPQALADLDGCGSPWCAQPYPYMGGLYRGLGCTRFTAALMAAVPDLWERVAKMSDATHPPMHWCRLDAWATRVLTGDGWRRCEHHVPVGHTWESGRGASHGCA